MTTSVRVIIRTYRTYIVVVCLIAGFTLNEQLTHTLNSFEPGFHLKPTTCMLQITENILRSVIFHCPDPLQHGIEEKNILKRMISAVSGDNMFKYMCLSSNNSCNVSVGTNQNVCLI